VFPARTTHRTEYRERVWAASLLLILTTAACGAPEQHVRDARPAWRHFVEPDAVVLIGGSVAIAATAYALTDPDARPRLFPADEGGAAVKGSTIPNWQVALGTSLVPILIASSGGDARWEHTKGAMQSLLTTAAATELAKNVFQRHRPRWGPEAMSADDAKSFFSGHSSLTAAATTYAGLYLHHHVFSRWRGDARFAWWEVPPYVALAVLAAYVPYTRIEDNMHHPSDVITGTVVGTSMSAAAFAWQEIRHRRKRRLRDSFDLQERARYRNDAAHHEQAANRAHDVVHAATEYRVAARRCERHADEPRERSAADPDCGAPLLELGRAGELRADDDRPGNECTRIAHECREPDRDATDRTTVPRTDDRSPPYARDAIRDQHGAAEREHDRGEIVVAGNDAPDA
jgi:membrane-associated phospholipid phosphatase